jgi:hypothetical protein
MCVKAPTNTTSRENYYGLNVLKSQTLVFISSVLKASKTEKIKSSTVFFAFIANVFIFANTLKMFTKASYKHLCSVN